MEELRSTEILDREIQSDARKKAENILKKADKSCEDILNSVEKAINEARKAKEDLYKKKIDAFKKNQDSSIPLEKERFEVSFVQKSIIENINKYLEALGQEKRMELVLARLEKTEEANLLAEKKLNAFVYGFDAAKMQKKLSKLYGKNLLKCESTDFGRVSVEDDLISLKEGVILESDDKNCRIRLTLSELVNQLFENHREELCNALFGAGGLA
ncbi:V-type ATP synthase subunit E family protein [Treponema sp. C6A8]|uniref:V-type ATP synthase subunit E family protein n=1 Tax=Treponema sp. C6A8 TaxID=1410609 RepID=UPI000484094D|nr:V-type ATP synthase subunit E family protein [Treponema sp. C6A8]